MTDNEEDLALSRRAAEGDSAAFATLVEKYERPLRAFLKRMGAGDSTDDVAQDAFFKAWRAAGQYDGRARYSTWLTKIAWRCRIDQVRRNREVEPAARQNASGSGAEVQDMLSRLKDRERAALILCDGHGWTHVEAAELLGMPLGTFKSIIARAKSKCREMWSKEDND